MSQHDTLTQALQQIADWNSHTTEYTVDYGSNGVRDFYRNIARAALSATQPAQAAQSEPKRPHVGDSKFESWYQAHPKANGGDKQLARDAYAAGMFDPVAQGAGEVVAWQASDGGSSYISNEARSRNSAFRELYTIPLYIQPAAGADVPPAQPAPVVPEGWEIREEATWVYFKRPDGFYQAVTPNDSHQSHAQTLHMLMRAMLAATPTPPAQAAADARDAERWRMAVLIQSETLTPPDHRKNQQAL